MDIKNMDIKKYAGGLNADENIDKGKVRAETHA